MDDNTPWSTLDLVVIDVEGNGHRPPELVELAAVPVTGGQIGEPVSWLVRPEHGIAWQARKVHGISDADVAAQPTFAEVADEVRRYFGAALPVGHNVRIDLGVLNRELPEWMPVEAFDTLRMSRAVRDLPTHKLGALVENRELANDLPDELRPHRADYDALVTARLLVDLADHSGVRPWTIAELRSHGCIALAKIEPAQQGLFP